jgi:hypothetical protein
MAVWRYHKDCRAGKIFDDEDGVPEGWVDSPAKLPPAPANPVTAAASDAPNPRVKELEAKVRELEAQIKILEAGGTPDAAGKAPEAAVKVKRTRKRRSKG